jgi:hypothetical protein
MNGWGSYSAAFTPQWLPDGRTMKILEDVTYTDPSAKEWLGSEDSVVDRASIRGLE